MPCVRHVNTQREDRRGPSPSPYPSSRSSSISRSTAIPPESQLSIDKSNPIKKPHALLTSQSEAQSHARKREEGYIKRPSNAFILFRTDFVAQGRIPSSLESHSQNLSRIAGAVWRSMSEDEKAPWKRKAVEVKEEHKRMFPKYEYHPTDSHALRGRRKVVKGRGERELREAMRKCKVVAQLVKDGAQGEELEKAIEEMEEAKEKFKNKGKAKMARKEKEDEVDPYLTPRPKIIPDATSGMVPLQRNNHLAKHERDLKRMKRREEKEASGHCSVPSYELPSIDELRRNPALLGSLSVPSTSPSTDEVEPVNSVSASTSALSSPASDASKHSLSLPPPLLCLPNTFIPPGHVLESELLSSKAFASNMASIQNRSDFVNIRNENPDSRMASGSKVTLPPIRSPTDADAFSVANRLTPKTLCRGGERNPLFVSTRKFPGALHVPDKPRSATHTLTSVVTDKDTPPTKASERSSAYQRRSRLTSKVHSLNLSGDPSSVSKPAFWGSSGFAIASIDSNPFGSSAFGTSSSSFHDKELAGQECKGATFRHSGSNQSQSQMGARSIRETEKWTLHQVNSQSHTRLKPTLDDVATGRYRRMRNFEIEIDSDRSVVGSISR
ncbi:hypothetical protein ACEPAH_9621 [Sanghuangporus vaninii]